MPAIDVDVLSGLKLMPQAKMRDFVGYRESLPVGVIAFLDGDYRGPALADEKSRDVFPQFFLYDFQSQLLCDRVNINGRSRGAEGFGESFSLISCTSDTHVLPLLPTPFGRADELSQLGGS